MSLHLGHAHNMASRKPDPATGAPVLATGKPNVPASASAPAHAPVPTASMSEFMRAFRVTPSTKTKGETGVAFANARVRKSAPSKKDKASMTVATPTIDKDAAAMTFAAVRRKPAAETTAARGRRDAHGVHGDHAAAGGSAAGISAAGSSAAGSSAAGIRADDIHARHGGGASGTTGTRRVHGRGRSKHKGQIKGEIPREANGAGRDGGSAGPTWGQNGASRTASGAGPEAGHWEAAALSARQRAALAEAGGAAAQAAGTTAATPWVEKHRPATLDDVVAHGDLVARLRKHVANNTLPHMLFYGPPGTGKTSTIMACAAAMHGAAVSRMVLEVNASDDNGVDMVRGGIKAFAHSTPLFSSPRPKLVVLDEAEYLTAEAQAALRHLIEQTSATTRFCFICNNCDAITPAIQSRCVRFRFRPLPDDAALLKLQRVVGAEGLRICVAAQRAIVRIGKGDMRRVLNVAQACACRQGRGSGSSKCTGASGSADQDDGAITEADVYEITGLPSPSDVRDVAQVLMRLPLELAVAHTADLLQQRGLLLADLVVELADCVCDPAFELYQVQPEAEGKVDHVEAHQGEANGQGRGRTMHPFTAPLMSYMCQCLARVQRALIEATDDTVQIGGLAACFALARHMAATQRQVK